MKIFRAVGWGTYKNISPRNCPPSTPTGGEYLYSMPKMDCFILWQCLNAISFWVLHLSSSVVPKLVGCDPPGELENGSRNQQQCSPYNHAATRQGRGFSLTWGESHYGSPGVCNAPLQPSPRLQKWGKMGEPHFGSQNRKWFPPFPPHFKVSGRGAERLQSP